MEDALKSDLRTIEPSCEASKASMGHFSGAMPHLPKASVSDQIDEVLVAIPTYLSEVYTWAYINPRNVRFFDHRWVVDTILWGNNGRLQRAVFDELKSGWHVLQACCVYGDLSPNLVRVLGPSGRLDVIDVVPIQLDICRHKLGDNARVNVRRADAAAPGGGPYDAVVSFFLLHEVPDDYKRVIVDSLLASLKPGGKVVFIDYHKPHPAHPLKWITALIFAMLEPFAKSLWRQQIAGFASHPGHYLWHTETYFGGLFQKTIVRRPS